MRRADAAWVLNRWLHFSAWNDVMTVMLKVWREIENLTPSIEVSQSMKRTFLPNFCEPVKRQSLRLILKSSSQQEQQQEKQDELRYEISNSWSKNWKYIFATGYMTEYRSKPMSMKQWRRHTRCVGCVRTPCQVYIIFYTRFLSYLGLWRLYVKPARARL